jgi:hypothetical protein
MMALTKVRDLLLIGAVAAIAMWLVASSSYGSLPPVNVFTGASLYPVAAIEAVLGFVIRARVKDRRIGDGQRQLHPIAAARAVALAKASAIVGAAFAGVWAGMLVYVAPEVGQLRAAGEDLPGLIVALIGGVLLAAAALWLEYCCRAPDDPEEPAA